MPMAGTGGAFPALSCQTSKWITSGAANCRHDPDDFQAAGLGQERVVETGAALFDGRKMEARRVADNLNVVSPAPQVTVWNPWQVNQVDDLRKDIAEVRIAGPTVARVPTGIYGQIHQVGQPLSCLVRSGRLAARQCPEGLQLTFLCPFDSK